MFNETFKVQGVSAESAEGPPPPKPCISFNEEGRLLTFNHSMCMMRRVHKAVPFLLFVHGSLIHMDAWPLFSATYSSILRSHFNAAVLPLLAIDHGIHLVVRLTGWGFCILHNQTGSGENLGWPVGYSAWLMLGCRRGGLACLEVHGT